MSAAATPSIRKDPGYLRIATEEAYAPAEMLRMYRKLLDEKGTDDPGFLSQWGYFLGQADRMQVLAERFHNLGEGRIADTSGRVTVMEDLRHVRTAAAQSLEPGLDQGPQRIARSEPAFHRRIVGAGPGQAEKVVHRDEPRRV